MHHGEDGDLVAQKLLVEQRAVALDEPGLLERTHAAQAGWRGNADPARQLHIGDAAVVLQLLENMAVDGVETAGHDKLQNRGYRRSLSGIGAVTKHYCAK